MLYETVIGLEIHVALKTRSKAFCLCPASHTAPPNTLVCPVCMGYPGTLPSLNQAALERAVAAGLALHCRINRETWFDRKHYFYPDLPKGYQITQDARPVAVDGLFQNVRIERVQLEEDAGKLLHTPHGTQADFNRAGIPLIEIVTAPDLRSAREAAAFARSLAQLMREHGLSDARMNEGSLRCDVNVSLRLPGEGMGTRTEIKNLNSFAAIEKATLAEAARQATLLDSGEKIIQQTRRYDAAKNQTVFMREKEKRADYRFIREYDIPMIMIDDADIRRIQAAYAPKAARVLPGHGLLGSQTDLLLTTPWAADAFEKAAPKTISPQMLYNLIVGELFRLVPEEAETLPIAPGHLALVADWMAQRRISAAAGRRLAAALLESEEDPQTLCDREGLWQIGDEKTLREAAERAIKKNQKMVQDYLNGRDKLFMALMGAAMKELSGRADAEKLTAILKECLKS